MTRSWSIAIVAIVPLCLAAPKASFAEHCESIEARCAIEIGGACDPAASHWMYGPSHGFGGNTAAFKACLARHGAAPPVAARVPMTGSSSKCTSDQGRCATQIGGYCNPKNGWWCVGGIRGNVMCGGTIASFMACLDRVRGGH